MKTILLRPDAVHGGNLILVNAQFPYWEGKTRGNLISVNSAQRHVLLDRYVVNLLSELMGELDGWKQITAVSGWRSMREQQEIYTESLKENGAEYTRKFVALPNHSEHQTGLAIDLGLKQEKVDFICPEFPYEGICQKFRERAALYGFIERYPKGREKITGIAHEPWHFRYVGFPHAGIMAEQDLVLEEYIDFLKEYPYGERCYSYVSKNSEISVAYLKAEEGKDTRLDMEEAIAYTVSGNNVDGYIITTFPNSLKNLQVHGKS